MGMTAPAGSQPGLSLLDVAAAFPSVDRGYLHGAATAAGAHPPFRRLLSGLYDDNTLRWPLWPEEPFCTASSGVAQGCPLSGFLFVLAADPLIRAMHTVVTERGAGIVRFCADDGAVCLPDVAQMALSRRPLQLAEDPAGLVLKPNKCVLVPLRPELRPAESAQLQDTLEGIQLGWGQLSIEPQGKYFGVFLGPKVQHQTWSQPLVRWQARMRSWTDSGAPAAALAPRYLSEGVSLLSYAASMVDPPPGIDNLEHTALGWIFRVPVSAWPNFGHFALVRNWGWPRFVGMRAMAAVDTVMRAVRRGRAVEQQAGWFNQHTAEHLPLSQMGNLWDHRWDIMPMCLRLQAAMRPEGAAQPEYTAIATQRVFHPKYTRAELLVAAETARYRDWVTPAVLRRTGKILREMIPPTPEMDEQAVELVRNEIRLLHPQWAVNATRPFLNLWCTSHRMHDHTRDMCLFSGVSRRRTRLITTLGSCVSGHVCWRRGCPHQRARQ